MKNIKFIGRKEELNRLAELKKHNFFLVLKGRRRIGKTTLLKHAFLDSIYIFVWPDKSIDWIMDQICREYRLPLFKNFKDILEYLLDKEKTVVIDEFQNFFNIDKSVYGELQKIIDDRKIGHKFLKIAVAGSSYSLMNKVFNDSASPLYGRRTDEINLDNIPIKDLFCELNIPLEGFIELWSIFEGVPYYYELLNREATARKNILNIILSKESQLQNEGKVLMSVEFGGDSKTYNTILTGISEGKTKLNELSTLFDNKKNEIVKYLDILRNDFKLVRKVTPITENARKSRNGKYEVADNFLSFWLYFIERNRNYIEQDRFNEIEEFYEKNFNTYLGRKFEKFIIVMIKSRILLSNIDFKSVGNQWGKIRDGSGESYEIDIVLLNEEKKEILFGECKWSNKINALEVVNGLAKKARYVEWNSEKRKEVFAVFAKSFSKRIEEFEGRKVYCFDLKDIENALLGKRSY